MKMSENCCLAWLHLQWGHFSFNLSVWTAKKCYKYDYCVLCKCRINTEHVAQDRFNLNTFRENDSPSSTPWHICDHTSKKVDWKPASILVVHYQRAFRYLFIYLLGEISMHPILALHIPCWFWFQKSGVISIADVAGFWVLFRHSPDLLV